MATGDALWDCVVGLRCGIALGVLASRVQMEWRCPLNMKSQAARWAYVSTPIGSNECLESRND